MRTEIDRKETDMNEDRNRQELETEIDMNENRNRQERNRHE